MADPKKPEADTTPDLELTEINSEDFNVESMTDSNDETNEESTADSDTPEDTTPTDNKPEEPGDGKDYADEIAELLKILKTWRKYDEQIWGDMRRANRDRLWDALKSLFNKNEEQEKNLELQEESLDSFLENPSQQKADNLLGAIVQGQPNSTDPDDMPDLVVDDEQDKNKIVSPVMDSLPNSEKPGVSVDGQNFPDLHTVETADPNNKASHNDQTKPSVGSDSLKT